MTASEVSKNLVSRRLVSIASSLLVAGDYEYSVLLSPSRGMTVRSERQMIVTFYRAEGS